MGGKAAIFMVLGFSMIFLVFGHNFNNLTLNSVDNAMKYHNSTMARYLASSGANLASNEIFKDKTWGEGFSELSFEDGTINVYVSNPYYTPSGGGHKVTICHIPPGNPYAAHDITISQNAVAAHLAHGCSIGACGSTVDTDLITIIAEGTYLDSTEVVIVELRPSSFAKFAYFSSVEGNIWWTRKDTVWGPFHTNDRLRVNLDPVFMGKASSGKSLKKYNESANPKFYGGYESGINIPIPTNGVAKVKLAADNGGMKFTGKDTVILHFANDSLRYKFANNDDFTTVHTDSETSNGVIFAEGAVVRLQGVVDGKYTVATSKVNTHGSHYKGGKVFLDDDIVYKDNPREGASDDLLGIVAENYIRITNNPANQNDINIHAAMYCQDGGFGAENYNSRPSSGNINLVGGLTQFERAAVGTFSGGTINNGFSKRYRYDDRLLLASPPSFPGTEKFEVVSWYE